MDLCLFLSSSLLLFFLSSDRRFGTFDKVLVKANQTKWKGNTAENVGTLIKNKSHRLLYVTISLISAWRLDSERLCSEFAVTLLHPVRYKLSSAFIKVQVKTAGSDTSQLQELTRFDPVRHLNSSPVQSLKLSQLESDLWLRLRLSLSPPSSPECSGSVSRALCQQGGEKSSQPPL